MTIDNEALINDTLPPIDSRRDTIICVIDRSGSMYGMADEAERSLNEFISTQRELGKTNVTLVQFDNVIETVWDNIDIKTVGEYKLEPRGMTALYDAIGQACHSNTSDGKVIVVVVTDGHENSSKEFTSEMVKHIITEREDQGWEFLFMGANQDAILAGNSLGIANATRSINYAADGDGITRAFNVAAEYSSTTRMHGKLAGEKYLADVGSDASNT